MKAPTRNEVQLGSRLGLALSGVAAAVAVVAWMDGSVPWLVPAVGLLLCRAARQARTKVLAYQRWRGAWDGMAGEAGPGSALLAPRPEAPTAVPVKADAPEARRARTGRVLLAAWAVLLLWLFTQPGRTDAYGAAALLWVLLTLVGAIRLLLWLGGRVSNSITGRERGAPKLEGDHVVKVCLPVPRDVPSLKGLHAALPDYCKPLLRLPQ